MHLGGHAVHKSTSAVYQIAVAKRHQTFGPSATLPQCCKAFSGKSATLLHHCEAIAESSNSCYPTAARGWNPPQPCRWKQTAFSVKDIEPETSTLLLYLIDKYCLKADTT